jgi:HTH-type transcriptional regulator/antitoxin MqsA
MTDPTCPQTGLPMVRDVRPMTIAYKGASATFPMPGWYCDDSGESIHSGEDMKHSDRALNRLRAQVEGRLVPEEVRRIRKRLGLAQKEAGRLIGGGPNAFQKYESGEVLVSHAVTSALVLLDRDPAGLAALRARRPAAGEAPGQPAG